MGLFFFKKIALISNFRQHVLYNMYYNQKNFLSYFLKRYHQFTLFAYENELKLYNSQGFLLILKAIYM